MERCFRRAEQFDEIGKLRVAAGIAAAADGDAVEIPGFCLEGGKGFLCDGPQILETRILLPDTFGTIVAACFERQAVAAAECPGRFHVLKVTVLAETPAVYACPSPDIHGQLSHSLLDYSVPVRIMYLELNGCGTGKNHCFVLVGDIPNGVRIFTKNMVSRYIISCYTRRFPEEHHIFYQ